MGYYNYHGTIKRLLSEDKLISWYLAEKHNRISPALVLMFDDIKHPIMPVREHRFCEYLSLLPKEKQLPNQ